MKKIIFSLFFLLLSSFALAQDPGFAAEAANMQKFDGFLPFYWNDSSGQLWLEIDRWEEEMLYQVSLKAGVGSNDLGLDRGKLGPGRVVKFIRRGPKVLMIQPNYDYRAESKNPDERKAVEEAFAQSVIGGFEVKYAEGSKVWVDATAFFMQDAFGVAHSLKQQGQGNYSLDPNRSAVELPACQNFPQNTELECWLTFSGQPQGRYLREVTPSPEAVTVRQHHSFIALPPLGSYQPREQDPRSGFFGISYQDYATPIGEPLVKRFISRHRLEKQNPAAEKSPALAPIIYYVDRGAPEPIRSALREGASWWNEAFEAAGFENAFRVEILPEGVNPLDVRYNVIQWVHRKTRGWSYGSTVTDPRTGEILKGHVSLGSLRVRQDFMIAQGLIEAYQEDQDPDPRMLEMALARLRQLAAHEVGHTLGLAHNFAASSEGRTSVMDYPHPFVQLSFGRMDFSDAYDVGIGEWDKQAIRYGYSQYPDPATEREELKQLLDESDLRYITDRDARAAGSAHPYAHLWDNGNGPVDELQRIMDVRAHALDNFGEANIPEGAPLSSLEEVLTPLYYAHRYQAEAVVKLVGGLAYSYQMRGDDSRMQEAVSARDQKQALQALLATLEPEALAIPEHILELVPPRPPGYNYSRETLPLRTGLVLDPVAAAEAYADQLIGWLLHPERASRLGMQQARDGRLPSLEDVITALLEQSWENKPGNDYHWEIQYAVNRRVVVHLMKLSQETEAAAQARAIAWQSLRQLQTDLESKARQAPNQAQRAHYRFHADEIERFLREPDEVKLPKAPRLPDGSPIGCGGE